jgi:CubicO group peptidase (beta-lactamase class C family)
VSRSERDDRDSKIVVFLQDVRKHFSLPGIAAAVCCRGEECAAAVGVSDKVTRRRLSTLDRFEAGCLTKLLLCKLAAQLHSERVIKLDQTVAHYLPVARGTALAEAKLAHLGMHTAGYQGDILTDGNVVRHYTWEDFIRSLPERRALFRPGTIFDYSHSAASVLGQVVHGTTGRPAFELVEERLAVELGEQWQASKTWQRVAGHVFNSRGRIFERVEPVNWGPWWCNSLSGRPLSVLDVRTIGKALLSGNDESLVSHFMKDTVVLPTVHGGSRAEEVPHKIGFGLAEFGDRSLGVNSLSVGQTIGFRMDPDNQIVVAVAVNAPAPFARDYVLKKLIQANRPKNFRASDRRETVQDASIPLIENVEGVYEGGSGSILRVRKDAGRIRVWIAKSARGEAVTELAPIEFQLNDNTGWAPSSDIGHLSAGFFRDLTDGETCLMVGLNAFKRLAVNRGESPAT